ncbi:hypothetical protein, partial [Staphylococcus haemolyticus]
LVAFANWCVRVFSKNFRQIEEGLAEVVEEKMESVGKVKKHYKLRELLRNSSYVLPLIFLTTFYLFWNLPANTWGSFVNYFIVTVDNRSQLYSTVIALVANVLCLLVNVVYLKISDSKYRYKAMYIGIATALI